jgi:hypothetical protein
VDVVVLALQPQLEALPQIGVAAEGNLAQTLMLALLVTIMGGRYVVAAAAVVAALIQTFLRLDTVEESQA